MPRSAAHASNRSVASGRDRAALGVLQLGALAVVLAAAPYKAFDLDRYFVPKELALVLCAAVGGVLVVSERRRLTLSVTDLLLAGFVVVSGASAALAADRWLASRALAMTAAGAFLFWTAGALRRAGAVRPLLVALALAVVVGSATALAQAYGIQSEYFSLNRAPGGTFGNRNFVAHLAAIGAPVVVLVAMTARRGAGSVFGGVAMAVVAAALALSRSRAAWLAVLALAVPVGILAAMTWRRWCDARTARRAAVMTLAAAAGAVAAVALPNHLEWKSDSPYLESAEGLVNYKEGSGHGRLVQYTNSLRLVEQRPLLGVGPGNWAVAYPKVAVRGDPSMSQDDGLTANPWPSSDWVAFVAERGVVGAALVLLAILALVGRALRDLRGGTSHDPERVLTAIALVGTLVATLVVGAFDAVLLVAIPAFFVWTLAGALSPPPVRGVPWSVGVRTVGVLCVLVVGTLSVAHSALELAAMGVYGSGTKLSALSNAAMLDPGNYRVQVKTAAAYAARGDCTRARPHAREARDLFPNAAQPKRLIAECVGR
jgi:O-antigen ligase